jgi:hypothetical protein
VSSRAGRANGRLQLLALAGDIDALIAEIRLRTPLQALAAREGWGLACKSFHDCTAADLAAADVVVVQRGASRRAWQLQQAARRAGAAVVCEIDDLLTELPAHISNQADTRARQAWLLRCLREADQLSVSTARLDAALREGRVLPPATIVPNGALPLGDAPLPAAQPGAPVTFLFASMDRLANNPVWPALRTLQAEGAGIDVVVMGPPAADFAAAGVPCRALPLQPRRDFIAFARSLPNVVAVIPLEASRFAGCKSAIKWFEYGEAGIPTLCSNVPPYSDVIDATVAAAPLADTLVDNTEAAWLAALRRADGDPAWRRHTAALARNLVRQRHGQDTVLQGWQQALAAALAARAAARLQPVPPWAAAWWGLSALADAATQPVRRWNRQRLARRKRR